MSMFVVSKLTNIGLRLLFVGKISVHKREGVVRRQMEVGVFGRGVGGYNRCAWARGCARSLESHLTVFMTHIMHADSIID